MNRSIRRLYLAVSAGFVLLVGLLGYWQVVAAGGLNDRAGNPHALQRERLIDRGRIVSADGKILAYSRAVRIEGRRVYQRVYPMGTLAPHVIGYVSETRGKTGLESTWNRYLAGSFGTEPLLQRLNLKEKRGANIRLTLDTRVQQAADDGLAGQKGAVVALDPSTGAVLAMASSPGFDLARITSDYPEISSQEGAPLFNRATLGRQPPGSTFKVVTAAAALEDGDYTPSSSFDDTGKFVVAGQTITNFGRKVFGRHTLTTALTNSINTTFARIGAALGPGRLGEAMTDFGFGERPPIDLPEGEVAISGRYRDGVLLPNDDPREDTARIAIGQEQLTVTPLQMAMVAATVATGGRRFAPFLVRQAVDRGGSVVRDVSPQELGGGLPPETAAALTAMMRNVVAEGTGTRAALVGLEVAGKTGTAESGTAGLNQAWFIGFAPVESPQVAVAVRIEDTSGTGGVVAAPVAAAVMKAALDR